MPDLLPVFAYGTLLPGQPNFWIWREAITSSVPAVFRPGRLHDMGQYPMLVENPAGSVQGLLVTLKANAYETTIQNLDALEGHDPSSPVVEGYRRVKRMVYLNGGQARQAWVYLGQVESAAGLPVVESGDWVKYAEAHLERYRSWWKQFWPERKGEKNE